MKFIYLILVFLSPALIEGIGIDCGHDEILCELPDWSGGLTCVPPDKWCDGIRDCLGYEDEQAEDCNDCEGSDLIRCMNWEGDLCRSQSDGWTLCPQGAGVCWGPSGSSGQCCSKPCDLIPQCKDFSDESVSLCPGCSLLCADNETCLDPSHICDTWAACPGGTDDMFCQCNATTQFTCPILEDCVGIETVCDGRLDCINEEDEFAENCNDCPGLGVKCVRHGNEVCLDERYLCDGTLDCTDYKDESFDICKDTCEDESHNGTLWKCGDGAICIDKQFMCNEWVDCLDASDETDCNHCSKEGYFECPSTPGLCFHESRMCDGIGDCLDKWDEMADNCGSCYKDGVHLCEDGLSSVSETSWPSKLCDGLVDCFDFSDEKSEYCGSSCLAKGMFRCEDGHCIKRKFVCTGKNLCDDSSEMSEELCHGFCYVEYPAFPDQFKFSCDYDKGGKCLSIAMRCDQNQNCEDGSDEANCPFVTYITTLYAIGLSCCCFPVVIAIYAIAIHLLRKKMKHGVKISDESCKIPKMLCHPPLSDLDQMKTEDEFEKAFAETSIEKDSRFSSFDKLKGLILIHFTPCIFH